jgi:hypothetical protein
MFGTNFTLVDLHSGIVLSFLHSGFRALDLDVAFEIPTRLTKSENQPAKAK